MPTDLFADNAATTLASSPAVGATSFTVTSAAGFPAASNASVPPTQFRVLIDTELLTITNVAGTTFTCGPTGIAHSSGDIITHILTAESLANLSATGLNAATGLALVLGG